jgi:hypothetical protein
MEEILNDGWNLRGEHYIMEEELHDGWKLGRKVEELKLQNAWKIKNGWNVRKSCKVNVKNTTNVKLKNLYNEWKSREMMWHIHPLCGLLKLLRCYNFLGCFPQRHVVNLP